MLNYNFLLSLVVCFLVDYAYADQNHFMNSISGNLYVSNSIDGAKIVSCDLFYYRLLYKHVREREDRDLLKRLFRFSSISNSDLDNLKQLTDRLESEVPDIKLNKIKLSVLWKLDSISNDELVQMESYFRSGAKKIRITDIDWESPLGLVPSQIKLDFNFQKKTLMMTYLATQIDACFGNSNVEVLIGDEEFRNSFQLYSRVPDYFRGRKPLVGIYKKD